MGGGGNEIAMYIVACGESKVESPQVGMLR